MSWPVLRRAPVELPELAGFGFELWDTMLTLAEELPRHWTLIGGQMVLLHALEHGVEPTRVSTDLDALVHFRAVANAVPVFVTTLRRLGFQVEGVAPDGVAHRYRRGRVSVDVLAPEGLGPKADLRTQPPAPNRTLQVPAGTQALQRTELLPVSVRGRVGHVPRPSLLGAIVGKAVAVDIDDVPDAQRQDLALLLSLLDDPFAAAEQLDRKDGQRLRLRAEMADRRHPAWRTLGDDAADRAHAALVILSSDRGR